MITTRDIHRWLEQKVGRPLNPDEGLMFGDVDRAIRGVTVCWMPSPENIQRCAAFGHELLIHHEAIMYPYPFENRWPEETKAWFTNAQRLEALGKHNLVATRLHGTIDELWIFDAFANQIGLTRVA